MAQLAVMSSNCWQRCLGKDMWWGTGAWLEYSRIQKKREEKGGVRSGNGEKKTEKKYEKKLGKERIKKNRQK